MKHASIFVIILVLLLTSLGTLVGTVQAADETASPPEDGTSLALPRLKDRLTAIPQITGVPSEAQEAIQTYARDVLGLEIAAQSGRHLATPY